jgi:hypothetical protein
VQAYQNLINNSKKLTKSKVRKDLFNFIRTFERELAAYNRATLYEDSQTIDKKPLGFYSAATELLTNGRKKKGEPFDLLESGDFLEGLFAKVQQNSILFDTTDNKKKKVVSKLLNINIFGLQDEDLDKIIETKLVPWAQSYFLKGFLNGV